MDGFDPRFKDLPEFILGITEEIWEGRQIGRIHDYYGADAPVKTPSEVVRGAGEVVQTTLYTLESFPDRQLLGEDVIWSEDAPGTFYSSHRIRNLMTYLGEGSYGPPNGRRVVARNIADCVCRGGQIVDEWLVRDRAAIASQLGLDPGAFGRELGTAMAARGERPDPEGLVERWSGGPDAGAPGGRAQWLAETYAGLWSGAGIGCIERRYDRAYLGFGPGGETLQGRSGLERLLREYTASIPDGRFQVHHWIERRDPSLPVRIAMRWTLAGTHAGRGRFGEPSGAPLVVMAISHAELRGGRVATEWHLIDEVSLWTQIGLYRGA